MERLKVGQVINTEKGLEKIVAMEWGNPVTIAVESLNSVVREPRSVTQESTGTRGDTDSLGSVARIGTQAVSQLIKL
jgi:hypothetical protein